jgi:hypothetical protein
MGNDLVEVVKALGDGTVTVLLAKDLAPRVLGPSFDLLGDGIKNFAEQRAKTVYRIIGVAAERLKEKLEEPGVVPPRVLARVFNEGSYLQDDLAVAYMGGVLASSRSPAGRDDRGARLASLVERLSAYQIRMHYIAYASMALAHRGKRLALGLDGRNALTTFVPGDQLEACMEFNEEEQSRAYDLIRHCLHGLQADGLLGTHWCFGERAHLTRDYPWADGTGLVVQPSHQGVELFLHALGQGSQSDEYLTSEDADLSINGVALPTGTIPAP